MEGFLLCGEALVMRANATDKQGIWFLQLLICETILWPLVQVNFKVDQTILVFGQTDNVNLCQLCLNLILEMYFVFYRFVINRDC